MNTYRVTYIDAHMDLIYIDIEANHIGHCLDISNIPCLDILKIELLPKRGTL
jgi:hypothetical protein